MNMFSKTLVAAALLTGMASAQANWDSSVPYSRKDWNPKNSVHESYDKIDWGSDVPYSRKGWNAKTSEHESYNAIDWGSDVPYSGKEHSKKERQEGAGR